MIDFNRIAAIAPNDEGTDNEGGVPLTTEATPPTPPEPLGEGGIKALQSERTQRKALEQQVRALEQKYGSIDPAQYQELLDFKAQQEQLAAEQRQRELEEKQNYEAAKAQLVEEWSGKLGQVEQAKTTAIAQVTAERDAIAQQYENLLVQTQLNGAFLKANGDPSALEMLEIPAIRGRIKLNDGALQILGDDGNPIDKDLDAWMAETVKPAYLRLFKPDNVASGGGTNPVSGGGGTTRSPLSTEDFVKLSPSELAARARRK